MHRRSLFKLFMALPGIVPATSSAKPTQTPAQKNPNSMDIFKPGMKKEYNVGGFKYHAGEYVWPSLTIGVRLDLHRDRAYPQDPLAVAVYWNEDIKIGYVPRPDNASIAQLLDDSIPLQCRITGKTESPQHDRGIRFSVERAIQVENIEPDSVKSGASLDVGE